MQLQRSKNPQLDAYMMLRERRNRRSLYGMSGAEFIEKKLGEHLWSKQREIIEALEHHRHVAVHSGHGIGKSWIAARAIAWWIETHPPGTAFALSTAPSHPQVRAILWRELNRAHKAGNLSGKMNTIDWSIGGELVALGRKPSDYNESAFQGIHAKYVLVVIDEACGVIEQLWTAADSIVTNEFSRVLAIGNPDDPTSHFARVCAPGSGWHKIGISVLDSPNFTGEKVPPDFKHLLTDQVWIDERKKEWGEEDPRYISKVLGQFPEDKEHGVIPLSWVRRAMAPIPGIDETPVELGFDVAASDGGDESVIRERRGLKLGRAWRYREPDTMKQVGHVIRIIRETGATAIKIDEIGIGKGVADRLKEVVREQGIKCRVHGVNVGSASSRPQEFPRLRDEIWWMGREMLQDGIYSLDGIDEETISQLTAPIWKPDSRGRVQVEPKDMTKKRINRSPDDADALLLAYYKPKFKTVRIEAM